MKTQEIEEFLLRTLDDGKLSRGEQKVLAAILDDENLGVRRLAALRAHVFQLARNTLHDPRQRSVLEWLEAIIKTSDARLRKVLKASPQGSTGRTPRTPSEAFFSPGPDCLRRIIGHFQTARKTVDVCVFTITDDRITREILAAHQRGVIIRVLTDDLKSEDPGSDIARLERAGLAVAFDSYDKHMHHKFALFDGATLLTGSYNWTRSAAEANEENLIVTRNPDLVEAFRLEFEGLWGRYAHPGD
jgi:phosphatidylserine/phosphatidylglycerophosphate/cardiolipin synthase-like enzyme